MTPVRAAGPAPAFVGIAAIAVLTGFAGGLTGCAECADNGDCAIGNECSAAGTCRAIAGDGVEVLGPTGPVDGPFDLSLRVRFRGEQALIRVDRLRGEPCLPFVPARQRLFSTEDGFFEADVVVPGLLPLGEDFALAVVLDVLGAQQRTDVDLEGPAAGDDVGGFEFSLPFVDDIDVVDEPWQVVSGASPGGAVVEVRVVPVSPADASGTPREVIGRSQLAVETVVPLVRGPQLIEVRSTSDGVTQTCGKGVVGTPDDDDEGRLELAILTEGDDPGWLGLSLQLPDGAVCDADRGDPRCERVREPLAPKTHNAEVVLVDIDDGAVDVAAVPRAISGPVTAWLRVTRGGRHVALVGPQTIFPDDQQVWIAAQVLLQGGLVQSVVEGGTVSPAAPW